MAASGRGRGYGGRLLGTFGMLPDFWMGFLEGSGCLLALLGAAMLIVSFAEKRKK